MVGLETTPFAALRDVPPDRTEFISVVKEAGQLSRPAG